MADFGFRIAEWNVAEADKSAIRNPQSAMSFRPA